MTCERGSPSDPEVSAALVIKFPQYPGLDWCPGAQNTEHQSTLAIPGFTTARGSPYVRPEDILGSEKAQNLPWGYWAAVSLEPSLVT